MDIGYVYYETPGAPIKAWVRGIPVEDRAKKQLENLAAMPFVHGHVAAMPDVHWGMGATVGSVFASKGAVIPAAVGVDIGCGMMAAQTSLVASDLPDNLRDMRMFIEAETPHGRTDNGGENDRGAWGDPDDTNVLMAKAHLDALSALTIRHPKIERAALRAAHHIGTLGTGNHFIEVCLDEQDRVWVMLHSGSRGIGNRIGSYFIELAKQDMRKWFVNLPDADLAYFPEGTDHYDEYIEALHWAQEFAHLNRRAMMRQVIASMKSSLCRDFDASVQAVECHHNYATKENHFGANVIVTRKGAVCARKDVLGIIPGSMGARSYIVRGKGNPDSFHSCSHGAGRVMSRGAAKKAITLEDHALATAGIECRKDADVLDESPAAYKDIDAVMAAQTDLVSIEHTLRQVLNVKG